MSNEELNTALYKKMFEEQEEYRDWLLAQSPEEILHHTYEYTVREDILLSLEYSDLPDAQAQALLASPTPLADVFRDFEKVETDHMEIVWDCIEGRANVMLEAQREALRNTPVYPYSAFEAYQRGEQDTYFASRKANVDCKSAIEDAIRENYHDNRLDTACVQDIIQRFGMDRVEYVLANTVQHKGWDERFSPSNREWAKTIPVIPDGSAFSGDRRTDFVVDRCHTGLTDLFISAFRKEQQKMREVPPRMSIYDQLRQPVPHTAALTKAKSPSQEL